MSANYTNDTTFARYWSAGTRESGDDGLFIHGGPHDGKIQNLITPEAFYMVRHPGFGPAHTGVIFDCGMQIAPSKFYFHNHNVITEMRVVF